MRTISIFLAAALAAPAAFGQAILLSGTGAGPETAWEGPSVDAPLAAEIEAIAAPLELAPGLAAADWAERPTPPAAGWSRLLRAGAAALLLCSSSACDPTMLEARRTSEMSQRILTNSPGVETIVSRISNPGGSSSTLDQTRRITRSFLGRLRPGLVARLNEMDVRVVVIPRGKEPWDIEPLGFMKGSSPPYGYSWSAIGGVSQPVDGSYVVAVREEKIVDSAPETQDGKAGQALVHELSHAVWLALTPEEQGRIEDLFRERHENGRKFPSDHATFTVKEYFCESTSAYLNLLIPYRYKGGPSWFTAQDRQMRAVLEPILGPNDE